MGFAGCFSTLQLSARTRRRIQRKDGSFKGSYKRKKVDKDSVAIKQRLERVRYYADERDTNAHALFAILDKWLNGEHVADNELQRVLTEEAYAVYERKLGVRNKTDYGRRTNALKTAFVYMDKHNAILTSFLTDEQKHRLRTMLAQLRKHDD